MTAVSIRKRMDAKYAEGKADGHAGKPRNLWGPYEDPDYRFVRWAYDAGHEDGKREFEALRRRLTSGASERPVRTPDELPVDTYEEIAIRLMLADEALNHGDMGTARIHIRWASHWHKERHPRPR